MPQRNETKQQEAMPVNLGREWIEGINRELRRTDSCLENMRQQCIACHTIVAGLRSDIGHLREDITKLQQIPSDVASNKTGVNLLTKNLEKLEQDVDASQTSWQEAKLKITLIWSGIATIIALVITTAVQLLVHFVTGK